MPEKMLLHFERNLLETHTVHADMTTEPIRICRHSGELKAGDHAEAVA
jgi:hypothetical protein